MTTFNHTHFLDVTNPEHVEINFDEDRAVLYINIDGITILRINKIPKNELYSNVPVFEWSVPLA